MIKIDNVKIKDWEKAVINQDSKTYKVRVEFDITAPSYILYEIETYNELDKDYSGLIKNLKKDPFKVEDFTEKKGAEVWNNIIKVLNSLREDYLKSGDTSYLRTIEVVLPSSYTYSTRVCLTYASLRSLYLKYTNSNKFSSIATEDIRNFCKWVSTIPFVIS